MRQFTLIAGIVVITVACNQKPSSENLHKPVPDVLSENLKGKIQ